MRAEQDASEQRPLFTFCDCSGHALPLANIFFAMTAREPEGTLCMDLHLGRVKVDSRKRFITRRRMSTGTWSPGQWTYSQACQSWRSVWAMLSNTGFEFWVVLRGARSQTWSSWITINTGYSIILLFYSVFSWFYDFISHYFRKTVNNF